MGAGRNLRAGKTLPAIGLEPLDATHRARPPLCAHRRVGVGEWLYRAGDDCSAFFVVRLGLLKSLTSTENGQAQITGFRLPGEVVGLDGIDGGRYRNDVVAVANTDVFVLPFTAWRSWWWAAAEARSLLMRLLGQEIARSHETMMLLGTAPAQRRVAAFLLDMSARYAQTGLSRVRLSLEMTRYEIGSFLGLSHECVSRMLSQFHHDGWLHVQGKSVALLDFHALREVAGTNWHDRSSRVTRILDRNGRLLLRDALSADPARAGKRGRIQRAPSARPACATAATDQDADPAPARASVVEPRSPSAGRRARLARN